MSTESLMAKDRYESPKLRRLADLPEGLLEEWGRMYGGGRYANVGYPSISTIATLIEHRGFRPDSQVAKLCVKLDSLADGVEVVVMRLQQQGIDGEAEAHCLRVAYDPSAYCEKVRLARLRSIGRRIKNVIMARISRREYYRRLSSAKEIIANALAVDRRTRKANERVSAL